MNEEPFLHGGLEIDDIEAAHEGRVQVGELLMLALIDGADEAAACHGNFLPTSLRFSARPMMVRRSPGGRR